MSTFTPDGILDVGNGEIKGRQAIKETIARMPSPAAVAGKRAGAARHNVSNIVIKVEGNTAKGASYGSIIRMTIRTGVMSSMGLDITKRRIYNEGRDEWAYKGGKNPAW